MGGTELEDRLRNQSGALNGLLSLVPAKMYYGEDNSNQWQRKKQTKEEARAAKMAKLDPDAELNRNAHEVMDERGRNKRKLREMENQDDGADAEESYEPVEGIEPEKPGEGLKKKKESNMKQKTQETLPDTADGDAPVVSKRTQEKLSKKAAKKAARKQKEGEKTAAPPSAEALDSTINENHEDAETEAEPKKQEEKPQSAPAAAPVKQQKSKGQAEPQAKRRKDGPAEQDPLLDSGVGFSDLQAVDEMSVASSSQSERPSSTFDNPDQPPILNGAAEPASATTSISSTIPPSEKPKHLKMPSDMTALRARLAAKIEALRAARKADGPDGKPIRTRQELIESRRAKEAKRKAHKQELRKQAKLEEARRREEALASNSPSVMSPAVELDEATGNFAFGRVAFDDGAQLSHDLSYVLSQHKKKGPSDPKTALLKVQNEKKRIEALDSDKREDVAEKEAWVAARRRIEGEKVRDDEAILKKAVKRKEIAKKKSEKAWKDRAQGVEKAQKEKQRKREENLKKRRDEKLLGKAGKKKKGGAKKKGRPGFEGSFGVGGRKK